MTLEIKRHWFHIGFGTVLALLFYFNLISAVHFTWLLVLSIAIFLIYMHYKIPIFHQIMMLLERKENLRKFPGIGAIYYVLGCAIVALVYPQAIAIAAIMLLAWGDGVAGLVRAYRKKPGKGWTGTIAAIIAGTIAMQFFVTLVAAFAASLITMLIERLPLRKLKIDDNWLVPVLAGAIMMILV